MTIFQRIKDTGRRGLEWTLANRKQAATTFVVGAALGVGAAHPDETLAVLKWVVTSPVEMYHYSVGFLKGLAQTCTLQPTSTAVGAIAALSALGVRERRAYRQRLAESEETAPLLFEEGRNAFNANSSQFDAYTVDGKTEAEKRPFVIARQEALSKVANAAGYGHQEARRLVDEYAAVSTLFREEPGANYDASRRKLDEGIRLAGLAQGTGFFMHPELHVLEQTKSAIDLIETADGRRTVRSKLRGYDQADAVLDALLMLKPDYRMAADYREMVRAKKEAL